MVVPTDVFSRAPLFILFILIMCVLESISRDTEIVTTMNGDVKGFKQEFNHVSVDTYLGIPYAQAPVGNLRFRAPLPAQNWTGVLHAQTQPNSCMQTADTYFDRFPGVEMWNPNTNISEDCLYLNIWVPRHSKGGKLATMLWIFGGSYVYGTITLDVYNGKYLAAKQSVIVASMQYRMGVQGFLYSGTDEAPGNMGLLDQQLAMKWIHDNIEQFGGDKTKITLFGESSGSVSISHHLLASSSWPYFNNVIMLSGTSLAPWAFRTSEYSLDKFYKFADAMECSSESKARIMKCLRNVKPEDLEATQWTFADKFIGTFHPVIDGVYLRDSPNRLLSSGIIKETDILLGTTKDEGEFFMVYLFNDIIKPENLWMPKPLNRTEYLKLVNKISDVEDGVQTDGILYTYEYSLLPSSRSAFIDTFDDILGDYLFKCSVHDFAVQFSDLSPRKGRTYVYSFEYRHSANPWPAWMGALHGYEIEMLFGIPFDTRLNYSSQDRRVSELMMDYFVTFAYTGTPNTATHSKPWPEFTQDYKKHIVFTQGANVKDKDDFRTKECAFWNFLSPRLQDTDENIIRVSNSLDPDETPRYAASHLDPNCLQQ